MAGRVTVNRAAVMASVRKEELTVVRRVAIEVVREVKHLMRDLPKTGRIYRRQGRVHQASAPGEAPAVDTSALLRSVDFDVGLTEHGAEAVVGSRAPVDYAKFLEYGTSRILPRPAFRPAAKTAFSRVRQILKQAKSGVTPTVEVVPP